MCVIAIAEKTRLKPEEIKSMAEANGDGIGMAWRLGKEIGYRKGISIDLAVRLAAILPLPYVFHARIATVGSKSVELCHPFPISEDQRMNGETIHKAKQVLFHNGHESGWKAILAASGAKMKVKRVNAMNDTQAIAVALARSRNERLLAYCSGKFIFFSFKRLDSWGKFEVKDGVHYSNLYWQWGSQSNGVFSTPYWDYMKTVKAKELPRADSDGAASTTDKAMVEPNGEACPELVPFPDYEPMVNVSV